MPTRDEVLGSLGKLLTDKSKLDKFAQALDKQADIAKQLDLSFKQDSETETTGGTTVSGQQQANEEVTLRKELESVLQVAFEQVKSLTDRITVLETEIKSLKGEAVQAAGDTPNASLMTFAQKYFQSSISQPAAMPDPSAFQTPAHNKGAEQPQGQFGLGVFNDLMTGKFDIPVKK